MSDIIFSVNTVDALSAGELTPISGVDIGVLLYQDEIEGSFVLGNSGTADHEFTLGVSGLNTAISGNLTLSTDKTTYSTQASGFLKSEDTQTIYYKYIVDDAPILGSGTLLIRMDEV